MVKYLHTMFASKEEKEALKKRKYDHYVEVYTNYANEEKVPFMREVYKAALKRVQGGTDGDNVEDWVVKLQKTFFKAYETTSD